jgi:hypothetical protein
MNDDMQAFIDWLGSPEWQNIVTVSGYYPTPNVDIQELLPVLKQPEQNQPDREPILLTPKNMKQHGFDLAITVNDEREELHPGQVTLTIRFSPIGHVIQKIRKLSLRIGEDVAVPVTLGSNYSMEFVLRKSLIGKTSLSLAETNTPQYGAIYIVHLVAFCSEGL